MDWACFILWWRIGAEFPDRSSFFEEINEKRITKEDE